MNTILILVIAGVAVIAGVLVYLFKTRRERNRDIPEEKLTTEIETTETAVFPPPAIKNEKKIIGEIDVFVRDSKISTVEISDPEVRIGRDPTRCVIVIPEPIVSKFHCSLVTRDNRVFLSDNDSTNGTYIDNEKIRERELKTTDTITLGKKGAIKLIFRKRD
jgi:hypothetical protein